MNRIVLVGLVLLVLLLAFGLWGCQNTPPPIKEVDRIYIV